MLQRFTQMRREERAPVLASALAFFFILTALMVLRPAREALGMQRGIEAVRWLFVGTAVVTLAVNPLFALLVSRYRRLVFINATYTFFAVSLLVFYVLLVAAPTSIGETSGMVFFIWFSVFNLFATMVFWGLMADRFSLDQGKRLFGLIAVGGTLGAVAGPWLASQLAKPLGTAGLLLVAVASLAMAMVCVRVAARLQPARVVAPDPSTPAGEGLNQRVIGGGAWEGLRAVLRSPYLMGIALYVMTLTVIATFIYFTRVQMVAALGETLDGRTTLFAQLDFYTQVTTLALQALLAGRLMKVVGVPVTLALLPLTAALGFLGLAVMASFATLVVFQAAFTAVQRGITRPARETLFTVVSRSDKYKSKAFIDTFVYRSGDVVGAQVEGALTRLGPGLGALISVSLPLAVLWGALGIWLGRQQARQSEYRAAMPASGEEPALRGAAGLGASPTMQHP